MKKRAIINLYKKNNLFPYWSSIAMAWSNVGIELTAIVDENSHLDHRCGNVIKIPAIEHVTDDFLGSFLSLIIPVLYPDDLNVIMLDEVIPLNIVSEINNILKSTITNKDDLILIEDNNLARYIIGPSSAFSNRFKITNTSFETVKKIAVQNYKLNPSGFLQSFIDSIAVYKKDRTVKPVNLSRNLTISLFANKYSSIIIGDIKKNDLDQIRLYILKKFDGLQLAFHYLRFPVRKIRDSLKTISYKASKRDLLTIQEKLNITDIKNVIAFSLYGDDPRYVEHISQVISSYKQYFPNWICRFYVGGDVNHKTIEEILTAGAEVFLMKHTGIDSRYMFWRFTAIDDNVETVLIRDVDSFCTKREKGLVEEWLKTNKAFHIIRDHPAHQERILGGLWGIKTPKLFLNITTRIKNFPKKNQYGSDQIFLQEVCYPLVKHEALIHDAFPRYYDEDVVAVPFTDSDDFLGAVKTDKSLSRIHNNINKEYETNNFTWS